MGRDKQFVCQKPTPKSDQLLNLRSPQAQDGGSSDEEEEEEEMGVASGVGASENGATGSQEPKDSTSSSKVSQSVSDTEQ